MKNALSSLAALRTLRMRRGATAIEYAMIGSLVGATLIVALTELGGMVELLYVLTEALVSAAI